MVAAAVFGIPAERSALVTAADSWVDGGGGGHMWGGHGAVNIGDCCWWPCSSAPVMVVPVATGGPAMSLTVGAPRLWCFWGTLVLVLRVTAADVMGRWW